MPISLSTGAGFVPLATFYFQEGKIWVFGAGISRSDAINKQVALKCLCLTWHVAGSSALHSHWLRIWLVALMPSTLCYKKIILQQSSNVKVLTSTPKIILAIALFWCGWGNKIVNKSETLWLFNITFKNAEELSQVFIAAVWTSRELEAKGKRGVMQHLICFSLNKQYAQVSHSALPLGAKSQCLLVNTFFPLSRTISLFSVTDFVFSHCYGIAKYFLIICLQNAICIRSGTSIWLHKLDKYTLYTEYSLPQPVHRVTHWWIYSESINYFIMGLSWIRKP